MKFLKSIFLALLSLFLFVSPSKASHILGGEITWECDSIGRYIFKMTVYRDCNWLSFPFQSQVLELYGNPLPLGGNNNVINGIILRPDSTKWLKQNNGYLDPECSTALGNIPLSCANGDVGVIQAFYFKSDTLRLRGALPQNGLNIRWTAACCRPGNLENVAWGGTQILKATIYPQADSLQPCADNSPKFADFPDYLFCRGVESTNDYSAIDLDGDSLVYSFGRHYNIPPSNPTPVPFANGYSLSSPLPDRAFDSLNIPAQLSSSTGLLRFKVNNGANTGLANYAMAVKVESYRNGVKNAEVRRELPVYLMDCAPLQNTAANLPPRINPPFYRNSIPSFKDSVVVGSPMNASIFVLDTNMVNQGGQELTIQVSSDNLTHNYSINGNCPIPGDSSCAYIWSFTSPTYDSTKEVYVFKRQSNFNGTLRWTPDCSDLDSSGGAKTYIFLIRVQDGHCPVPAIKHEVIEITVLPDPANPCGTITNLKNEANWTEDVQLFPNPTNGLIQMNLPKQALQLRVFTLSGQLLQEQPFNGTSNAEFNLEGPSGIYFLEISNKYGERVFKKVVKQ